MLKQCCVGVTGPCEQVIRFEEQQVSYLAEGDRAEPVGHRATMDIALLQEQYNRIKAKQRLQTQVILFKKGSKIEDVEGKYLVSVVPVSQELENATPFEEQIPVKKIQFNLSAGLDSDKILWRTHLGIHRMTCVQNGIKAIHVTKTDDLDSQQKHIGSETESMKYNKDCDVLQTGNIPTGESGKTQSERQHINTDSRKLTSPATVSRKLSLPVIQSPKVSSSLQHYPFPQQKWQKKSEAARRLGIYSVNGQ